MRSLSTAPLRNDLSISPWYFHIKRRIAQLCVACISILLLNGCTAVAGLPPHIAKELTPSAPATNNYHPKEAKQP